MLIDTAEGNISAFSSSSKAGEFILTINKSGTYFLIGRALGYRADTSLLHVSNNVKSITRHLILREDVTVLQEVIVSSAKPITIKKDTIIIDAKSFALGNEQVAEDLLKRIPGIEVTGDGTIKVGNREVERIMVDGDDFFEKGYKLLTKNLNADAIDKVEIYDKYSKNRLLSNIENSDKVALNLKLKADSKQQWFGNISAGYGVGGRHEIRSNVMAYRPKSKYYLLANINNAGYDASGDINALVSPGSTSRTDILDDRQTIDAISNLNVKQPQLRRNRINFNNVAMPALNGIWTLNDKMKLKLMSLVNFDRNSFVANGMQTFFTNGQSFQIFEGSNVRKKIFSGIGRLNYLYDISARSSLEYTGLFNQVRNTDTASAVFNSNPIGERLDRRGYVNDHKLAYTNKTGPRTAVVISARYLSEDRPLNYALDSIRYQILSPTPGNKYVNQQVIQQMSFGAFETRVMHRQKDGSLMELQAGFNSRIDRFGSELTIKGSAGSQNPSSLFGNQLNYVSSDLYLKTNYRYKFKGYHFVAGLEAHQLINRAKLADTLSYRQESPFFLVPALGMEWQIGSTSKLTATYRYSFSNSGINDIYRGFTLTDYRNLTRGIGDFNQMNTSSMLLNYRLGNWGDNFFMNAIAAYKKDRNFVSSDNFIQPDYIAKSKIVLGSRDFFNVMMSADRFIRPLSSNIRAKFTFDDAEYKNRVNGLNVVTNSRTYNYGLEIRSALHGFFNFNVGRSWAFSRIKSTFDNSYQNNMSFLDLDFIFNNKFSARTQAEFYQFENLNSVNNQLFIDAEVRYVYLPNKLTFFLSGRNLLNRKSYTEITNQDISVAVWQYRLVPRIVNLKVDYRF